MNSSDDTLPNSADDDDDMTAQLAEIDDEDEDQDQVTPSGPGRAIRLRMLGKKGYSRIVKVADEDSEDGDEEDGGGGGKEPREGNGLKTSPEDRLLRPKGNQAAPGGSIVIQDTQKTHGIPLGFSMGSWVLGGEDSEVINHSLFSLFFSIYLPRRPSIVW